MKSTRVVLASLAAGLTMIIGTAGTAVASTAAVQAPSSATAKMPNVADQAPDAKSECAQYSLCLWKNKDYGDPFTPLYYFSEPPDTWLDLGDSLSNTTSSLLNYRDKLTWIAQFANGTGLRACIPANKSFDNLGDFNWPKSHTTVNDSITSYEFATSGTCPLDYLLQAN